MIFQRTAHAISSHPVRFFPFDEFARSFRRTTNGNRPYGKRVLAEAVGIQTARRANRSRVIRRSTARASVSLAQRILLEIR